MTHPPRPSRRSAWTFLVAPVLAAGLVSASAADHQELVRNGGVEDGSQGWSPLWTRDPGTGQAAVDPTDPHQGKAAWRIEHTGTRDWSLAQAGTVPVRGGDLLEVSAWIRLAGTGTASLGLVTRTADGTVLDWNHGGVRTGATAGWQRLHRQVVVPAGTATIQLRLIGDGPAVVGLDQVSLVRTGTIDDRRTPGLPPTVTIANTALRVAFDTLTGAFAVEDRRTGRTWSPGEPSPGLLVLAATPVGAGGLDLRLLDVASSQELTATLRLDGELPELLVGLHGDGPMDGPLAWPPAFASQPGELLILPVNEGISYPVDDASLPAMHYHLYGGHGLCMPWYGVVEDAAAGPATAAGEGAAPAGRGAGEGNATAGRGAGWMAIVETGDDGAVDLPRRGGRLQLVPQWEPQRGAFGDGRRLRFVFATAGGYVALAKRYRTFAKDTGLFRTLAEKRAKVPAVDQLVGAVNVWCWDEDAPALCRELQLAGIDRILWSNGRPAEQVRTLNAMGVLTSRYDIYQDAMDPTRYPELRWIHPDWTGAAWAKGDVQRNADGQPTRGWEVETKAGPMIPCGVLCDRQALPYARERIAAELKTVPYRCRFIDTTTASPWRECWDPRHPMTRSDSRRFRMELLRVVSGESGLVCGSETGHDAAVPVVDYFEGMLSLGPYRVPDAGRDMARRWDTVPAEVATFQTGHRYRLPLWELVYHDCVVAHWYWGDYSDKLPALWDRRDRWNALYGTAPMFMFDRAYWRAEQERFVRSYRATAPIARATGYGEMLDHVWLTPDHAVQRTRFAGGVAVTVNFSDQPWTDQAGTIPPLGSRVEGLAEARP